MLYQLASDYDEIMPWRHLSGGPGTLFFSDCQLFSAFFERADLSRAGRFPATTVRR